MTPALLYNCYTHCNVLSLQYGSFSRSESTFTPESPGSFPLRSSYLMCERFDLRANTRRVNPASLMLLLDNLKRENRVTSMQSVRSTYIPLMLES